MKLSNTHFEHTRPYWRDYLPFLHSLADPGFPGCDQLNALLRKNLRSAGGHAIRFVPSAELDDDDSYEQRIFTSGKVSTRPDNWHDLFNALVWMRFPRIKIVMNKLHHQKFSDKNQGTRGTQRDALTLLDECGVIVFSQHRSPLEALLQRNWSDAFQNTKSKQYVHHVLCGHAMLEKYMSPYKSMTAKALLVRVSADLMALPREELLVELDTRLADLMLAGEILDKPAYLTPLPLAGIPGWWPGQQQNDEFYADQLVFRPPPEQLMPATPIVLV